jgi:8-oxo-dGTP pyrophosphatase MutT (NUDIX family)
MVKERHMFRAAVYAIVKKNGRVLFLRRFNTGWGDGKYTLPAGHVDSGESIFSAVARELKEEVGININSDEVRFVHVMQRKSDAPYFDFYFEIRKWTGVPKNMELGKCDDLVWIKLSELAKYSVLNNVKDALNKLSKGVKASNY